MAAKAKAKPRSKKATPSINVTLNEYLMCKCKFDEEVCSSCSKRIKVLEKAGYTVGDTDEVPD